MNYWISRDGLTTGPYAESQIISMWQNGTLTVNALCWSEGYTEWVQISTIIDSLTKPQSPPSDLMRYNPSSLEHVKHISPEDGQKTQSSKTLPPRPGNKLTTSPAHHARQKPNSMLQPERDGISGLGCLFSGLIAMLLGLSCMHRNPILAHSGLAAAITILAWMRLVRVGKSPWLCVLGLVPFINFAFAIFCLVYRDSRPMSKMHVIISWCCFIVLMVAINSMGVFVGAELNLGATALFMPYLISITLHWKNGANQEHIE